MYQECYRINEKKEFFSHGGHFMTPPKIGYFGSMTKITVKSRLLQRTQDDETSTQLHCDQEFYFKNYGT